MTHQPPASETSTPVEILRKARALISDPARWGRGQMRDHDGRMCMLGAIAEARVDRRDVLPISVFVQRAIPRGFSIAGFNDDEKTTHADVLAAFDRAIALAESEGAK